MYVASKNMQPIQICRYIFYSQREDCVTTLTYMYYLGENWFKLKMCLAELAIDFYLRESSV